VLAAGQALTAREKARLGRDVEDGRKHGMRGMHSSSSLSPCTRSKTLAALAPRASNVFSHHLCTWEQLPNHFHWLSALVRWRPDGLGCDGACMQWPSYWIPIVASLSRRSTPGTIITLPRLFRFCGTANAGIKDLIPSYQISSAASAFNSLPCRSCRVPSISTDHSGLFYHHMSASEHDASAFEPK
jgi:hypothetical protein